MIRGNGRALVAAWAAALSMAVGLAVGLAATGASAAPDNGDDGPDVAMVIAGSTGRTTTLRAGDARTGQDFALLWQLLEPTNTTTERAPETWQEDRYPPVRFTVFWGLTGVGGWPQTKRAPGGDVAVERQDQLFMAQDGTPWIRSDPAPEVEDDDIRWHRAPRDVLARVDQERLLADDTGSESSVKGSGAALDAQTGAWWAILGLALGAALGAGGSVLIRRAAARHEAGPPQGGSQGEPRQELIDL
ncbi:hypothetical protein [Streptomyces soliscabiei]|uniref:hypothetical protein n=1 Tax=Streptomyces soliscabiei TaxID=588897 RepID=UPI0029ADE12C|nr:hypothetical protein [Streptomyces sp. NY05-11A]MDX2675596.1 hypothetical protein [Streptomyces sp. NY05-11A]